MNRNIIILSCSQALGLAGAPMVVLTGGIIGADLAPDPAWATLPLALMVVGGALCSIPAALLMRTIGRRAGFMSASLVAAAAASLGAVAISGGSFTLFCLATIGLGANMAFVQQYRFAAAESVPPDKAGRAISSVLVGGIAAAFLGPELAKATAHWQPAAPYTGSYALLAILLLANTGLLSLLEAPQPPPATSTHEKDRPFTDVLIQPLFLTAVMAGVVGYGVMTFIMTATPVSMHLHDGFSLSDTALVIQSHVVAMYLPSFFSGRLIDRFGLFKVMAAGVFLNLACVAIGLIDHHFIHYWSGLILLGLGWNLLFVGGTALLTRCYRASERFRAQAVNDFIVFGFQALASLSAGAVIFRFSWETVNLVSLPLLCALFCLLILVRKQLARP